MIPDLGLAYRDTQDFGRTPLLVFRCGCRMAIEDDLFAVAFCNRRTHGRDLFATLGAPGEPDNDTCTFIPSLCQEKP